MVVMTTGTSPVAGHFMRSVVRPCGPSSSTTLHLSAPEEGFWCTSCSSLVYASASLAENCCCLQSKITGVGVSPESLICAPRRVVGRAPRMDLTFRLRRCWRSSRLPTSLGSHLSSLPYRATAWRHTTWTTLTVLGTTPYPLGKGSESSFCCPGILHASVVLLLEHSMCVHPDHQPACRMCVESYEPVSDCCYQIWPEVFPVAPSVRESCRLRHCNVEL